MWHTVLRATLKARRPGQLRDHLGVPLPTLSQYVTEARPLPVGAGQPVVHVDSVLRSTEIGRHRSRKGPARGQRSPRQQHGRSAWARTESGRLSRRWRYMNPMEQLDRPYEQHPFPGHQHAVLMIDDEWRSQLLVREHSRIGSIDDDRPQ